MASSIETERVATASSSAFSFSSITGLRVCRAGSGNPDVYAIISDGPPSITRKLCKLLRRGSLRDLLLELGRLRDHRGHRLVHICFVTRRLHPRGLCAD